MSSDKNFKVFTYVGLYKTKWPLWLDKHWFLACYYYCLTRKKISYLYGILNSMLNYTYFPIWIVPVPFPKKVNTKLLSYLILFYKNCQFQLLFNHLVLHLALIKTLVYMIFQKPFTTYKLVLFSRSMVIWPIWDLILFSFSVDNQITAKLFTSNATFTLKDHFQCYRVHLKQLKYDCINNTTLIKKRLHVENSIL